MGDQLEPAVYRNNVDTAKVQSGVQRTIDGRGRVATATRDSNGDICVSTNNHVFSKLVKADGARGREMSRQLLVAELGDGFIPYGHRHCRNRAFSPADYVQKLAHAAGDHVAMALVEACREQVAWDESLRAQWRAQTGRKCPENDDDVRTVAAPVTPPPAADHKEHMIVHLKEEIRIKDKEIEFLKGENSKLISSLHDAAAQRDGFARAYRGVRAAVANLLSDLEEASPGIATNILKEITEGRR